MFFNAIILRSNVNYCEIIKPCLLVLVGEDTAVSLKQMCHRPVGCSKTIPSDFGKRKSTFQKTGPAAILSFCRLHFDISILLLEQVIDGLQSVTLTVDYIQLL